MASLAPSVLALLSLAAACAPAALVPRLAVGGVYTEHVGAGARGRGFALAAGAGWALGDADEGSQVASVASADRTPHALDLATQATGACLTPALCAWAEASAESAAEAWEVRP